MLDYTSINLVIFVAGLVCCVLYVYHLHKEPRRILCGILMVLGVYLTLNGGLRFFFRNITIDDGTIALGVGEDTLIAIKLLALPLCLLGGIALCVNGVGVIKREGKSLAIALPLLFGILAVSWPFVYVVMLFVVANNNVVPSYIVVNSYQIIMSILSYVIGMLAAFFLHSLVYAALPKPKNSDYVLTLGGGLRRDGSVTPLVAGRLNMAIEYQKSCSHKPPIIVSGGKGSDERVSEASAMRQYLLGRDVPDDLIICEDQSVNTRENIQFSKNIMDSGKDAYSCMIVTSDYHVLRAVILARISGLNAQGIGSRTAVYYSPAAFIREYIAIIFSYKKLILLYTVSVTVFHLVF